MKRFLICSMILLFSAVMAEGADFKIGYVDFNHAINESDNGKKTTEVLKKFIDSKQELFLEKESELKALEEDFKKQLSVLTPESRKDKEDQLRKLYIDFQRMEKDFNEEIQKKQAALSQDIQDDLIKILQEIGKKEGYTIILERAAGGILYSQKGLDITSKLVKKYNEYSKTKK